jgi:hypothetical protein
MENLAARATCKNTRRFQIPRFETLEPRHLLALTLDLIAEDDTGNSSTDNLTNIESPQIKATFAPVTIPTLAIPPIAADIYLDGSSVGSVPFGTEVTLPISLAANESNSLVATVVYQVGTVTGTAFGTMYQVVSSNVLNIDVDTEAPNVSFGAAGAAGDGLNSASDSGVATMPATFADRITSDTTPSFWGRGELDSIVRLYVDGNGNGSFDSGSDPFIGQATVLPANGLGDEEDGGFWEVASVIDFNDPTIFSARDGLRTVFVTVEDAAGNPNEPGDSNGSDADEMLQLFIDTQGPQITSVDITNAPAFDLFNPKPTSATPTPLINSLTISFADLPDRATPFLHPAVKSDIASNPAHYQIVGDTYGVIPIKNVFVNAPAPGSQATATVSLEFFAPLPDDRFTLTVADDVVDPAGNQLDGESNAHEPQEDPVFPTGDSLAGGAFEARFTVDSRPEIGAYVSTTANLDIDGNFKWNPATGVYNDDFTNVDLAFNLPLAGPSGEVVLGGFDVHDLLFAGNFAPIASMAADGFDKLAAYGAFAGDHRWIVDTDNDGVVNPAVGDIFSLQPLLMDFDVLGAIPIAGNFDGKLANGDEVGLYNSGVWVLDSNRDFVIDTAVDTVIPAAGLGDLLGHPIVGDFDGNGVDDLAVFNNNQFSFDLNLDGLADDVIHWGFPGVLDKPVAADMDQDGIDDIGLWVPRDGAHLPKEEAEWFFLLSHDFNQEDQFNDRFFGTVNTLNHPFRPIPFGHDIRAEFGDEQAMPIVGNFDPILPQGNEPASPALSDRIGVFKDGLFSFDLNGNGKQDEVSNNGAQATFGNPGELPLIGDWDGDGDDEVGVRRKKKFLLDLNGNGVWDNVNGGDGKIFFGNETDTPVIGDWNGDGADQVGVRRKKKFLLDLNGNGVWDNVTGGDAKLFFGSDTDLPVSGDWNGDGVDEVGVRRAKKFLLDVNGNGTWDNNAGGDAKIFFGAESDVPVVGDWSGNGFDQIGVRRKNKFLLDTNGNGTWDNVDGGDVKFVYGSVDDIPIAGSWPVPSFLHARTSGDFTADTAPLTSAALEPIVTAGIQHYVKLGIPGGIFSNVSVGIGDLPGTALGRAVGNSITIDVNAAGHGWRLSQETRGKRQAPTDSGAGLSTLDSRLKFDLLTTVMHELGHVAGLEDIYDEAAEGYLMYGWLEPGMRWTALESSVADSAFAGW